MKHKIDFDAWERRDSFNFFKDFLNPFTSITLEADCTDAKARSCESGQSFFLYYLYAVLRAVNEIKEFRYRLELRDEIFLYDRVDVLTPIRIRDSWRFYTVRIGWQPDFDTFYSDAKQIMADIPADANPFSVENSETADGNLDVIHVSATPDLFFTSVSGGQKHRNGSDFPIFNVGKAVAREGRLVLPIALSFHHGFLDGYHIAQFIEKVESCLRSLPSTDR